MDRFKVNIKAAQEEFFCHADETLLQGMSRHPGGDKMLKSIPVGCRGGGCGICRVRILEGELECKKMSVRHVTKKQQQEGLVLACRAYPRSNIELEMATPEIVVTTKS
ncbi:MAG TPA: 2Fe-2S iron-sulfur cluster binding domain-containing protein [Porticoccus sp.]|nr:2Fe-2S iron-sulfur cluster binding domain-containing protein [Porticoccus sp.]